MLTAQEYNIPSRLLPYLDEEGDPFRVPVSFEEYLSFADIAPFKVEYSQGNLVHMGSPTDAHELICGNLIIWLFNEIFQHIETSKVYGSNLSVLIQESGHHYRPDVTVLESDPEFVSHRAKKKTYKSVINPFLVAEVFSDGTMDYDYTEKLPNYKLCPTLNYILLVHQHKPFVTLYQREQDFWKSREYNQLDQMIQIGGHELALGKIYQKVKFLGKSPGSTK